jgi:hypothetical protein
MFDHDGTEENFCVRAKHSHLLSVVVPGRRSLLAAGLLWTAQLGNGTT